MFVPGGTILERTGREVILTAFALNDWPPFRQHSLDLIETSLRTGKLVDGPNTAKLEAD